MAQPDDISASSSAVSVLGLYTRAGFVHPGVYVVPGPFHQYPPDSVELARPAVERIVAAYIRAQGIGITPAPSLWDHATQMQAPFCTALERHDTEALVRMLGTFFQSSLVWGIARQPGTGATDAQYYHSALRTADALISLAQALGVEPVRSLEQQGPLHEHYREGIDFDRILAAIESAGLDLSCLPVASNFGWRVGARITNTDTLVHTCTVMRLLELGATADSSIAEIGGGYGCMAAVAHRVGPSRYTIYDLPWVNAIQGYILIRALGHEEVRLFGERGPGRLAVEPFWRFQEIRPRSVDYVVNVNSLPEIGGDTARAYIRSIADLQPRAFLSVNQEAMSQTVVGTRQHRVADLVAAEGRLRRVSRALWWMEQGYVEELFEPSSSPGA